LFGALDGSKRPAETSTDELENIIKKRDVDNGQAQPYQSVIIVSNSGESFDQEYDEYDTGSSSPHKR
jgi:hypothetical protein